MWKNWTFGTRLSDWQNGKQRRSWRGSTCGRGLGKAGKEYHNRGRGNLRSFRNQDEQNNAGTSAWLATANTAYNSDANSLNNIEVNWLLDSGCTDHIINKDEYFDECIKLREPVNIYLGDNCVVKATKVGNVISYFETFGKRHEIVMKNVFYANNMHSN